MKTWYSVVMYKKGTRIPNACWTVETKTKLDALKHVEKKGIDVFNNKEYYFEVEDGKFYSKEK